jgi:hypothetical protein
MVSKAEERLAAILAKVDRAKKHIADLIGERQAFLQTDPYAVSTRRDPQSRRLIYYISKVRPVPIAFSTLAGEVVQNLRSSLDHLAYQLFLVGTKGQTTSGGQHIYFPIARDVTAFRKDCPNRTKGIRKDAVDVIRHVEPYGGGNGSDLWTLHSLNNIDKHRLFITVGGSFQSVSLASLIRRGSAGPMQHFDAPIGLRPADKLCPLKLNDDLFIDLPDAEEDKELAFGLDIALKELDLIDGEPLIDTMQRLTKSVEEVIPKFKMHLQ